MRPLTDRLYPSLRNINYLVLERRRELLAAEVEKLKLDGRTANTLLDIGARGKPYQQLFAPVVKSHIGLDLTPDGEIIANGENLPFRGSSIDLVLCTQVLAHVRDPVRAIAEIYRVLKPGGAAYIAVPSVGCRVECPEDYWRFMPSGLALLLDGFKSARIIAEGSTLVGFVRTMNMYLHTFTGRRWARPLRWLLHHSVFPINNISGQLLDSALAVNDTFAVNWLAVATK